MTDNEPKLPCPPLATSEDSWDGVYLRHDRQPPFEIPRHSHAEHTLIVGMDNGLKAEWYIDGKYKDLQYNRGDAFIVPAGAEHRAYWKQESEGILLALKPESLTSAAIELTNSDRFEITPQFAATDLRLLQLAQWLLYELREQQVGSSFYTESLVTMLKIHLLRNYNAIATEIPNYTGGLARHKLRRAIAFIQANLENDIKLKDLAAIAALSPYHFSHVCSNSQQV